MAFLTREPIEPGALLSAVRRPSDGGLALFVGVVRNHDEGRRIERLLYEAYGPMAENEMARIAGDLTRQHPEANVLMLHRLGALEVGEVAVAVAASAPHREQAFAACRAGIEAVKARIPIWKKEFGPAGSTWVTPCGDRVVEAAGIPWTESGSHRK